MNKSSKVNQAKERNGYKFRLIVANSATEHKLVQLVGCYRFVWNKALALVKQDADDYRTMATMSQMSGGDATCITGFFKFNPYQQLLAMHQA